MARSSSYRFPSINRGQRGVTLVFALVMLVVLSLLVLSSYNMSVGSMLIVDNSQQRAQALNAASTVAEKIASNTNFAYAPSNVLDNTSCPSTLGAPSNSTCVDVYGDGKSVVKVVLPSTPVCKQVKSIDKGSLKFTSAEDQGCSVQDTQAFGVAGATSSGSLCSDSLWQVDLEATEVKSGTKVKLSEGVSVRVSNDSVQTACP